MAVAAAVVALEVSDGALGGAKEGDAVADLEHPTTATNGSKVTSCRIVSPGR